MRYKVNDKWIDTPKGVAHFLEHLMFNTAQGNALTRLSENGASANAYTSTNTSAYYFECVDRFYENLEILIDFVSVPYFDEANIENERGIIEQEILMCTDDPDHCLYYGLMESLYKINPLRYPIAGTIDSIKQITTETLLNCFNIFYQPSNMALCVVGDIDPSKVREIAVNILSETPKEMPERYSGLSEDLTPERFQTSKEMDVSLPIFLAGCKSIPPAYGTECLRYSLISSIALDLLAGHSSPLFFKLYNEGLVSSDFSASFDFSLNTSYSIFGGETRDPNRVFEEIKNEISRLSINGTDSAYFNRIKKAALGSYTRSLNSFEAISSNTIDGHFLGYNAFEAFDVLSGINEDDIITFYRCHLMPDNMAISIIKPRG